MGKPYQYSDSSRFVKQVADTEPKVNRSRLGFSGKTLWDWLQLLIIPIILASGAIWFNIQQNQASQQIALDQQRQTDLSACIVDIQGLLLNADLRTSKPSDKVRVVAKAEVLSTLGQLDGERKGFLIRFLSEAGLVTSTSQNAGPVIDLSGADLSKADLSGTVETVLFISYPSPTPGELGGGSISVEPGQNTVI